VSKIRTGVVAITARCLTFVLVASAPALAQEAAILGSAVDGTKAAVPGVTMTATATMIDTGRAAVAVTDERGEYRLRHLAPGR